MKWLKEVDQTVYLELCQVCYVHSFHFKEIFKIDGKLDSQISFSTLSGVYTISEQSLREGTERLLWGCETKDYDKRRPK